MKHLLLILIGLVMLSACKVREHDLSSLSVRTDTVRFVTLRLDTFRLHDSIFIRESFVGDTIRIERHHYHTKYRTQLVHDTVYQHLTDTIRIREVQTVERNSKGNATPYVVVIIATAIVSIMLYRKFYG
jgi:hypothetical protein